MSNLILPNHGNISVRDQASAQCLWTIREHRSEVCLAPGNWAECVSGRKDHRRCVQKGPGEWNKVTSAYRSAVYARILGTPSPVDMTFKLMAVGKGAQNAATISDIKLEQEIFRKTFLEVFQTSDGWIQFSTPVGTTSISTSTTVAAAPAPTSTIFTVTSALGMAIGTYISVQTPSATRIRIILAIAGAQLTVADLGEVPVAGAQVSILSGDVTANSITTLVGGTPTYPAPTQTTFSLLDVANLGVGTRIRIQTPSTFKYRTVLTLAGQQITVTDLGEVPLAGSTVDTVWGEMALWMGPSADPFTANSGTMVNRVVLTNGYFKDTTTSVSIEAKFRENLG